MIGRLGRQVYAVDVDDGLTALCSILTDLVHAETELDEPEGVTATVAGDTKRETFFGEGLREKWLQNLFEGIDAFIGDPHLNGAVHAILVWELGPFGPAPITALGLPTGREHEEQEECARDAGLRRGPG